MMVLLILLYNFASPAHLPWSLPIIALALLIMTLTYLFQSPMVHWNHIHLTHVYASPALALNAKTAVASERRVRFDTDSGEIGVDNRCTACISHDPADFEPHSLKPTNRVVKGFAGSVTANVQVGTLVWTWENDEGVTTTFRIPDSYYVPSGSVRLLSPQHWAQTQGQSRQDRTMFTEHTDGLQCILTWDQGRSRRTIPLSRGSNVATFSLAPGYSDFQAFCLEADILATSNAPLAALPAGMVSDDDGDQDQPTPLQSPILERTIYKHVSRLTSWQLRMHHSLPFRQAWSATTTVTKTNQRRCNPRYWSARSTSNMPHSKMLHSPKPIFLPVCHPQRGIKPHLLPTLLRTKRTGNHRTWQNY
jgi:hypothetical protein